jgi:hypothetical protein
VTDEERARGYLIDAPGLSMADRLERLIKDFAQARREALEEAEDAASHATAVHDAVARIRALIEKETKP